MISIKRAYESPDSQDGVRILVDRVWPRGISKETLHLDTWMKDVAPSTALRKWFAHDPARWEEFQHRYSSELDANRSSWEPIVAATKKHKNVTLIYSAKDADHNNALALKEYLRRHM